MSGYLWRGTPGLALLNAQILAERPHPDVPKFGNTGARAEAPCGTEAAYGRHRRAGEQACEACKEAERLARRLRLERRRAS